MHCYTEISFCFDRLSRISCVTLLAIALFVTTVFPFFTCKGMIDKLRINNKEIFARCTDLMNLKNHPFCFVML